MKFRLQHTLSISLLLSLSISVQAKSIFNFYLQNQTSSKIDIRENGRFNIFYSGSSQDNRRIIVVPEGKNAVIEYIIMYCDNRILPCSSYKTGCAINLQNFVDNDPAAIKATIYPLSDQIQCTFNNDLIVITAK